MVDIVECHSDYTYAERPVALTWEGRRLEISRILAQARTPDGKWFRVQTAGGQNFELLFRDASLDWQILPL
jgi:hypothetical protein